MPSSQTTESHPLIDGEPAPLGVRGELLPSETGCKWPHGDARALTIQYCNHPRPEDRPYCAFHRLRSINLTKPKLDPKAFEKFINHLTSGK